MRLIPVFCLLGTLACYSPTPQVGLPCAEGMACPDGQSCNPTTLLCNSESQASCLAPEMACDGVCLDVSNDPLNCGDCGNACSDGEVCGESSCSDQCPMTAPTVCGQSCADTQTDVNHCGMCDKACDSDETCIAGQCQIGEVGLVDADQPDFDTWHTVTLSGAYRNPVVIMGPPTSAGADPMAVRVRNVTPTSFDFQLSEWEGIADTGHGQETLAYLVVEAGTHTLGDDSVLKAGVSLVSSDPVYGTPTPVTFAEALPPSGGRPLTLLSQLVSTNTPAPAVDPTGDARVLNARTFDLTETGFSVQIQAEEAYMLELAAPACGPYKPMRDFAQESVAWVAVVGPATGSACERIAGAYVNDSAVGTVEGSPVAITFNGPYATIPAVLADMQTFNGGDQATLRTDNLTTTAVQIRMREDTTCDTDLAHADEDIAGLACIAPSVLRAQ